MKRLFILLYVLICVTSLRAEMSVKSCTVRETDLDARINYPVTDSDGSLCALIKMETTETGFDFDAGQLGIMKVEQKDKEVWVYVPRGVKHLTIKHPKLGMCTHNFEAPIESATVYELELSAAKRSYYQEQKIN